MAKQPFQIILLAGKPKAGRSTAAMRLCDFHGFLQNSFDHHLKKLCAMVLETMDCHSEYKYFDDPVLKETIIRDMDGNDFEFQRRNGSIVVTFHMTYAQFMYTVGVGFFRNNLHSTMWTMPVLKTIKEAMHNPILHSNGVVITDFEFYDEYKAINDFMKNFGNFVSITTVYIMRPESEKLYGHKPLKDFEFDVVIRNDASITGFILKIDRLATGAWRLDKLNHEIKQREQNHILNKYNSGNP